MRSGKHYSVQGKQDCEILNFSFSVLILYCLLLRRAISLFPVRVGRSPSRRVAFSVSEAALQELGVGVPEG